MFVRFLMCCFFFKSETPLECWVCWAGLAQNNSERAGEKRVSSEPGRETKEKKKCGKISVISISYVVRGEDDDDFDSAIWRRKGNRLTEKRKEKKLNEKLQNQSDPDNKHHRHAQINIFLSYILAYFSFFSITRLDAHKMFSLPTRIPASAASQQNCFHLRKCRLWDRETARDVSEFSKVSERVKVEMFCVLLPTPWMGLSCCCCCCVYFGRNEMSSKRAKEMNPMNSNEHYANPSSSSFPLSIQSTLSEFSSWYFSCFSLIALHRNVNSPHQHNKLAQQQG